MNPTRPSDPDGLRLSLARRIDQACNRFEAAWKAATSPAQWPRLEEFLGDTPEAERLALLRELLPLDVHYRQNWGESPRAADYRGRFPSLDQAWLGTAIASPGAEPGTPPPAADRVPAEAGAADRNLLFGVLALQADLIDAGQFVEACTLWASRKQAALADLLVERGWISPAERAHIEFLLERKLRKHGGDARAGLAAVADASVRQSLATVPDAAVQQSLAELPPPGSQALVSTVAYQLGSRQRYALTRLHAAGGLGQVWLAHDGDLGRDVALKELRPERADSPLLWARFLEEARITGQLEHPGIVPVYELARQEGDGRPFYTMRFVKGRTLSAAIKAYHEKRRAGRAGPLDLRELLQAFVGVCQAVAYAHARGVLHRDLKGQNVVLGDFGEVIVLDWGLAKLLGSKGGEAGAGEATGGRLSAGPLVVLEQEEERDKTAQGQVLGTPAYMSPEQAEGPPELLDRRSDVYGLGAVLYEILTGRPPFAGSDGQEILWKVVHEPPVPPRARVPNTPPALQAVCLKALAKRREERYDSAGELAREVERWLADEPVGAYREPVGAWLLRWGRRHRPWVVGATALLLTAVVALAAAIVAVSREQKRTESARQRTREALDEMSSQVIEDWLSSRPQLEPDQRAFLEKALAYYEAFAAESGQTEEVRKSVADAHLRVGNIRDKLGQHGEAEAAYRRAQELYASLAADFPALPQYRWELAQSYRNLGLLLETTGRPKEGEVAYRDALALCTQLAADFPTVPRYRLELAQSHRNLGILLKTTGRPKEAEAAYRDALDICGQLIADFPTVPQYRQALATNHNNLGNLLKDTGRPKEAEAAYRDALAVQKRLVADLPAVPQYQQELARSHNNLGVLLYRTGRPKEAEAAYRDALAVQKQLAADFPTVPQYQQELARTHGNLGNLLKDTGRPKEAEAAYRDALAIFKRLAADFPTVPQYRQELALSYNNLGVLLSAKGRPKEAEAAFRDALAIQKRLAADFPTVPQYRQDLALSHGNLGELLKNTGRVKEAEAVYREALTLFERLAADFPTVPNYQSWLASTLDGLAELARDRKDFPLARQLLEQSPPHHQAALDANPRNSLYREDFRENRQLLAATLLDLGEHASAAEAAADLARIAFDPANDAHKAACFLSRCVPLAQKDAKLSEARRKELARSYGDRALETLRQAVARGYKDAAHLKKDPNLEPLRPREDFQKLVQELEAKTKPRPAGERK